MSGHPLLRLKGDIHERLEVIEAERGAGAPGAGLILERAREGRREERALLADILPDRHFVADRHERCRWARGSFTALRSAGHDRRDWWGYRSETDCLRRRDC